MFFFYFLIKTRERLVALLIQHIFKITFFFNNITKEKNHEFRFVSNQIENDVSFQDSQNQTNSFENEQLMRLSTTTITQNWSQILSRMNYIKTQQSKILNVMIQLIFQKRKRELKNALSINDDVFSINLFVERVKRTRIHDITTTITTTTRICKEIEQKSKHSITLIKQSIFTFQSITICWGYPPSSTTSLLAPCTLFYVV
jgi:hypothetical protein